MSSIKRGLKKIGKLFGAGAHSYVIAPSSQKYIDVDPQFGLKNDTNNSRSNVIISYGTRDGTYDVLLNRLMASCQSVGMECDFETIPSCSRTNACLFKPTFIKFKLLTLGTTVVWVDADSVLTKKIEIPNGDWDIGVVNNAGRDKEKEISSTIIAFRPTIAALRFIEAWELLCSSSILHGLDHTRLEMARKNFKKECNEINFTDKISGAIVFNRGLKKEKKI